MKSMTRKNMELVTLDGVPEDRKNEIMTLKNGLSLSYESVLDFGSSASKNLSNFSTELLTTIKVKDTPEVESMLTELMAELSEVDCDSLLKKKPNLFKKILKIDDIKNFIVKYEDVQTVVNTVRKKLEQTQYQLKKDIELCDNYLEENSNYINELDNYIMAGKLKVQEVSDELKLEEQKIDKEDRLAVQELSMKQADFDRLDRKVHDLSLMREIAIQNIPQIALIKSGDAVLIEKIQSSINSAIPLWESQMVIAIELMRQKGALAVQKSIVDTTNKLIAKNSELLKSGSVEIAKELERGIVDIETLKKSQQNLIETLETIKTIRKEGREKRLQVAEELNQIQGKLHDALLLTD